MDQPPQPFRVTEGLLLAAAPGYGYLLAYLYRRGFAERMHIPLEFIQVGLQDLLLTTAVGIFLLFCLGRPMAAIYFRMLKGADTSNQRLVLRAAASWLVLAGSYALIYRRHLERVTVGVGFATLIVLLSLWSTWTLPNNTKARPPSADLDDRLFQRFGRSTVLSIFALFFVATVSYALGDAAALDRAEYLVTPSGQEVALAVYGDRAILAPYQGRRFDNKFRVLNLTDTPPTELETRRVGPLRPREIPQRP